MFYTFSCMMLMCFDLEISGDDLDATEYSTWRHGCCYHGVTILDSSSSNQLDIVPTLPRAAATLDSSQSFINVHMDQSPCSGLPPGKPASQSSEIGT